MSVVVKVGGVSLEQSGKAVERIQEVPGTPKVIVHGGGVQITRMMERMKIEPRFVDGLRVTDEKALQAVAAALLGEVHTALVAALQAAGLPAVGVFGAISASRREGPWGLVGTGIQVNVPALNSLLTAGYIPVVATLAVGQDSLLNVNGDETAAAIAVALGVNDLVFLTDVEGVKDKDGQVFETGPDPAVLLMSDFVTGGMLPKLRAVQTALEGGVAGVRVGRTRFASAP
jgi:acetylglutamate kinase